MMLDFVLLSPHLVVHEVDHVVDGVVLGLLDGEAPVVVVVLELGQVHLHRPRRVHRMRTPSHTVNCSYRPRNCGRYKIVYSSGIVLSRV